MRADIAERWIAALESGNYAQGTGCLRTTGDSFCCLGVLTDLAIFDGVDLAWKTSEIVNLYEVGGKSRILPVQVMDWAGMRSVVGSYGNGESHALSVRNDEGATFNEIAAIIRANVDVL